MLSTMKKRSLVVRTRISKPPALSREDAQMDPNDFHMRNGMRFYPVACGKHDKKKYYRLALENSRDCIVGIDALEDRLRTVGLNLRTSTIENILNTLMDVIPSYKAETGHSVRLGNLVTFTPYATGTLAHANDEADPSKNHVEIRAVELPVLRYALSRAHLVNTQGDKGNIQHVAGGPKGEEGIVDEDSTITVTGRGIYVPEQTYDTPSPMGRAWVESLTGEQLGRCDVLKENDVLLILKLHMDKVPRTQDARLVIETYGTREAAQAAVADDSVPLLAYRRNIRILPHR